MSMNMGNISTFVPVTVFDRIRMREYLYGRPFRHCFVGGCTAPKNRSHCLPCGSGGLISELKLQKLLIFLKMQHLFDKEPLNEVFGFDAVIGRIKPWFKGQHDFFIVIADVL